MIIGLDAKRAFRNRTGLGNFSRWHIELMLKSCPEDQFVLFGPNPEQAGLFHPNHPHLKYCSTGKGLMGNYRRVFPGNLIIKNQVQLYHGLSNELPLGNRWSGGIKTIVTIHDLIFIRYPELYGHVNRSIYRYKLKQAIAKADLIHCVSESTAEDLKTFTGADDSRIVVIPLGSGLVKPLLRNDQPKYTEVKYSDSREPILLCVSSTEARKNLIRLVKAFAQSDLPKEWSLVIAGKKGDMSGTLHQAILDLSLTDRVRVIENPESSALRTWYQRASAFIYPSLYEGFGIPVLEALYFGLPVLCAGTSSLPEVGGKAAWYFEPNSIEQMSEAINRLMDTKAVAMLREQRDYQVKKFDDERIGVQWKNLYHSLGKI